MMDNPYDEIINAVAHLAVSLSRFNRHRWWDDYATYVVAWNRAMELRPHLELEERTVLDRWLDRHWPHIEQYRDTLWYEGYTEPIKQREETDE